MEKYNKCPICKGRGKIPMSHKAIKERSINKGIMAKLLRKEGYSIRQIMRFLEYKSTLSVTRLLKEAE